MDPITLGFMIAAVATAVFTGGQWLWLIGVAGTIVLGLKIGLAAVAVIVALLLVGFFVNQSKSKTIIKE